MNPSSPSTATSGDSPRPSLSQDASSTGVAKKLGSEIIEVALRGERKLWRLRGPWWPGVSRFQVALRRVPGTGVPHGLTLTECLAVWGLERNETTAGLFSLAENYDRLFNGRIIVTSLATKWILSAWGSHTQKSAGGEELTKEHHMGAFQGVSLRYISVEEEVPGTMCKNNEKEFFRSIVRLIEEYLLLQPVPEGHRRFFHGTSTRSMNSILDCKIEQLCFEVLVRHSIVLTKCGLLSGLLY
jgi:hypothetical protein